jgi:hypothetical protein
VKKLYWETGKKLIGCWILWNSSACSISCIILHLTYVLSIFTAWYTLP